jgi:hypothetical protein
MGGKSLSRNVDDGSGVMVNQDSRLSIRKVANGGFIVWIASDIVFAGSSIDEALTFIRNTLEPVKVDEQKKAFNEYPLPPGLNVSPEQQAALNEKARQATQARFIGNQNGPILMTPDGPVEKPCFGDAPIDPSIMRIGY